MREFALGNEYGQRFYLNTLSPWDKKASSSRQEGFLHDPEGLGFEMEYSYSRVGNSWVVNYLRDSQKELSGTLIIGTDDPYISLQAFLKFIRTSKDLRFIYKTTAGEYYKRCDITSFEKSQINTQHVLTCAVTFMPKGLWCSDNIVRYALEPYSSDIGKKYKENGTSYSYSIDGSSYTYDVYPEGTIDITNDGTIDADMEIQFDGIIVNPSIELYEAGVLSSKTRILGAADVGESIKYSSKDGNLYCYLDGEEEINLTPDLSIEDNNFFKIPVGYSSLKLSSDNGINKPVTITIHKYYRQV